MYDLNLLDDKEPNAADRRIADQPAEVLKLSERVALLETVIDNFPGGICFFDSDWRMVVHNGELCRLLDYPLELFAAGPPTLEALYRFNAARGEYGPGNVEALIADRLARARRGVPHVVERIRPNGIALEIRGTPVHGGFVTTYLDVTTRRHAQDQLAMLALHDPLTGLPNRRLMADRLDKALARVARGEQLAVLCLDLDGFKGVNDRLGHAAGDELLRQVAARLTASVRKADTVARLGGDEFTVVQVAIKCREDAAVLAQRMLKELGKLFDLADGPVEIGCSIGIAVAPNDGFIAADLQRLADAALYRCKAAGKGSYMFADVSTT